jgi:hypothetical protein
MFDAGKQLTLRNTIAPQFVGHDHPRHILQNLQHRLKNCGISSYERVTLTIEVERDLIFGRRESRTCVVGHHPYLRRN